VALTGRRRETEANCEAGAKLGRNPLRPLHQGRQAKCLPCEVAYATVNKGRPTQTQPCATKALEIPIQFSFIEATVAFADKASAMRLEEGRDDA
jgi:hypothetical protein